MPGTARQLLTKAFTTKRFSAGHADQTLLCVGVTDSDGQRIRGIFRQCITDSQQGLNHMLNLAFLRYPRTDHRLFYLPRGIF